MKISDCYSQVLPVVFKFLEASDAMLTLILEGVQCSLPCLGEMIQLIRLGAYPIYAF